VVEILETYLDMKTGKVRDFLGEDPRAIDGAWRHFIWSQYTMGNGNAVIIFTEGGRLMNDTSAICICYISIYEDSKCFVLELEGRRSVRDEFRNEPGKNSLPGL
jgi:hypothetical protein